MPGAYYCNGEMEECKDSSKCYKNGGNCYHTKDSRYAAKEKPFDAIRKAWSEAKTYKSTESMQYKENKNSILSDYIIPSAVSIIAAFVTALIITLVKML